MREKIQEKNLSDKNKLHFCRSKNFLIYILNSQIPGVTDKRLRQPVRVWQQWSQLYPTVQGEGCIGSEGLRA
ncbi:hypothetical protein Nmel_008543 [Mimus melanotis]